MGGWRRATGHGQTGPPSQGPGDHGGRAVGEWTGGAPTSAPEGRRPGWFELHWYWLGLIPVIWGCWALIRLLPVLLFALGVTNSLTSAVYSF